MIGKLHKKEDRWVIRYKMEDDMVATDGGELSIHPDDVNGVLAADIFGSKMEGREVEFEIVNFMFDTFVAKIIQEETTPFVSDDFQIGPDGAYEHSDRNISFQSILWKVSEQLQNVQYDNGDISDLGNEIGISVGKGVENMTENEISIFISGIRHGISLTNGTH
jgi:hypothetical protein